MDQSKLLSPERCARRIIKGMGRRKRLILMSERSKNLRIGKLLVPWLVDFLAARAVRR
jgi:hypothetical protein